MVAGMARVSNDQVIPGGYKEHVYVNKIFEPLRYIDMKKHPEHAIALLPAIEYVYPDLESLPASWTIIGARWGNIGLAKAAGERRLARHRVAVAAGER